MTVNRVVITGLGVVAPNANSVADFEDALRNGQSGIRFIPQLETLNFSCQIGGVPQGFEAIREHHFGKDNHEFTSDNVCYAGVAAMDAWADAGLEQPDPDGSADWDTGAVVGCGIGDMDMISNRVVPMVNEGKVRRMGTRVIEQVMASGVSAKIAGLLGLGNQVTSNSSACNTGTEAIAHAALRIRTGLAKRMVAGGSDGASPYTWGGFDSMRVLARKFNQSPDQGSRPMSASACGFVPGAGAGILILESLESARKRGVPIYAEIIGFHINCGGQRKGGTMTAPSAEGVQRCLKAAMADANIHPHEIDAISGHLTATLADPYEFKNWAQVLDRRDEDFPFINATKSMIGHCLGAAGAIETIAAVLELKKGFLHPSLNCEDIHPDIRPYEKSIVRKTLEIPELTTLAKTSFGFGDVNGCLILRKWKDEE
ncbi:MAG: beta-ketoacyl-[acyl-carrier-protein] synthase family protein [Proteobacteria bacterium]|nr:beta-ketoacyl-[acyl-carrier-protein] synthase family protein [Pseudomonadota bacterium]